MTEILNLEKNSKMNPMLLQKQLKDNTNDLHEYFKDIKLWGEEMKRKEDAKKKEEENKEVEPQIKVPKVKKLKEAKADKEVNNATGKTKKPKDFSFWDKFDVDAECEKLDKEKSDSDSDLTDEVDESMIDLAMEEKEKGNKFVKNGRYEDAIKCYTNAIENYSYDPVFYANRALCHLKLKQYKAVEADCTTALQIDKEYVKALHRRALAREALEQYSEAVVDLEKVLQIDSTNTESKQLLEKVKKKCGMETTEPSFQRPISKFTLSRQKVKEVKSPQESNQIEAEPVEPAFKPQVYERINPLDKHRETIKPQSIKEQSPQPSTSTMTKNNTTKSEHINWPSGCNVTIMPSFTKTPKERSKLPLKRIQIYDVDLKSDLKLEPKPAKPETSTSAQPRPENAVNNKILMDEFKIVERKPVENKYENLDYNVDTADFDFSGLDIPPPTTSVQFYQKWKYLDEKQRFLYLRQINPVQYVSIFKDSLESKVFSEILCVLSNGFIEKNVPVFEYLYGLTKVKRFGALVMFKSSKDKTELLKLIDAMRTDSRRTKDEVDYLIKKYEM